MNVKSLFKGLLMESLSLAEKAYAQVETMIVSLELTPGSPFSEKSLAKTLNIGRTPLREALQKLVTARLIINMPRRGMLIAPLNISDFLEIIETRKQLDRLFISKAAQFCTDEMQKALKKTAYQQIKTAVNNDIKGFTTWDREADKICQKACQSVVLADFMNHLQLHSRRFWYFLHTHGDLSKYAEFSSEVAKAIANKLPEKAEQLGINRINYLEQLRETQYKSLIQVI